MSRRTMRLQFLVCPQKDFIGTPAELTLPLSQDYVFDDAQGCFVRTRDADGRRKGDPIRPTVMREGGLEEDASAEPIREIWDLIEDRRRLHVGREATAKLRGSGNGSGDPFVEMMGTLFEERGDVGEAFRDRLAVILDEDWHPRSCHEFKIFGVHCVKGSDGARLPGALERFRRDPRTHILRANSINPAANPDTYVELVKHACRGDKVEYIKCGIAGVWSHVKVEYLAVALSTLPPYFRPGQIGLCEPLCGARETKDHDMAVEKWRALGFNVFTDAPGSPDSPGSGIRNYLDWMAADIA